MGKEDGVRPLKQLNLRTIFFSTLAASTVTWCAPALAQSGHTEEELQRRLDALADGIARYKNARSEDWLTPRRAAEIRALVSDVIEDASTRASLLQDDDDDDDDVDAEWDDGFFIELETADGEEYKLEIAGQIQIRHVYNSQDDFDATDTSRSGFESRRTKLDFEGDINDWMFGVTLNFADDTGAGVLNDARIGYRFNDAWEIQAGRFRSAMLREEDVSSKRQLLVERSLVSREFDQGRNDGIELKYRNDRIRLRGAVMDSSMFSDPDETWVFSARAEWLAFGEDWDIFSDFSSFPDDARGLMIGVGALYENTEIDDDIDDDEDVYRWTADASLELGGCNLFAAIIGSHPMEEDDLERMDQFGAVVQGGVFVTDQTELFGQYQWGDTDRDFEDLSIVTVGVNHFFEGHDLKLTFDVGYAFDPVESTWASGGAGWREDEPEQDGQLVARTQLQLLF
jgi:hypothetical protein